MHHECIVYPFMRYITILSFNMRVFFVYLGSHGETRLLLVDRLGNKNPRVFRFQIKKQRTTVFHHRNKLFIPYPGRVKEYIVAKVPDFIDDLAGIIDAAVVCTELYNYHTDRALRFRFYGIFLGNEFANIFFVKAMFQNTADGSESISRRL